MERESNLPKWESGDLKPSLMCPVAFYVALPKGTLQVKARAHTGREPLWTHPWQFLPLGRAVGFIQQRAKDLVAESRERDKGKGWPLPR